MKKLLFFLNFLIILPLFTLANPPATEAGDRLLWSFYSNNRTNLIWEVGFRYKSCYETAGCGGERNHSMWYTWVNSTFCSNGNRCRSGREELNEVPKYAVQWGTSCVDPVVKTSVVDEGPYNDPSNVYYGTGWINITANNRGIDWFEANGGGNIPFGSSFSDLSRCPVIPTPSMTNVSITTNCTSADEPRIRATWNDVSYADYYDIQRRRYVSGAWTDWSSTSTLNDNGSASFAYAYIVGAENSLFQIRVRAHTIAYVGGPTAWDTSPSIRTLDCTPATPTPRPTVCTAGARRCMGDCTYQVCNSTGTAWGSNLTCPINSKCTFVGGVAQYSCQASAGSCTVATTCTFSQCEGSPLACVTRTQNSPCPATNCDACSGPSACF